MNREYDPRSVGGGGDMERLEKVSLEEAMDNDDDEYMGTVDMRLGDGSR